MSATSKYARLIEASRSFDVPELCLVDEVRLRNLFSCFDEVLAQAVEIVAEIARTKSCFIEKHMAELHAVLDRLTAAPGASERLGSFMRQNHGADWQERRFAVRSTGLVEDTESRSFAGLYDSFLDVDAANLLEQIRRVWLSGFGQAAVIERIAAGAINGQNPMQVMVQRMVEAHEAGVAFSLDPLGDSDAIVVEAVHGNGHALVDGSDRGQHYSLPREKARYGEGLTAQVARLALAAEAHLGNPADIEWAHDGERLWLLQLRPITTGQDRVRDPNPVLRWSDLYGDDAEAFEALAPLPDFAHYFRAKRKRIADFGRRHGLYGATALAIRGNALGLQRAEGQAMLDLFGSDQIVFDLNDTMRQIILPRDAALHRLLAMMGDPEHVQGFVLRDFVQGDVGLISECRSDGSVFVEWSVEGLMAINRGTARTRQFLGQQDGKTEGVLPDLPVPLLDRLVATTRMAQAELGPIRVEWVAGPFGLMAVDFSEAMQDDAAQTVSVGDVVAHGYARARIMVIRSDDALHRMSVAASVSLNAIPDAGEMGDWFTGYVAAASKGEPPIVVVDRPYAALAALIPHVAGFVFENASLLCHLAILLRESNRPALQSPELYAETLAAPGAIAEIDTKTPGLRLLEASVHEGSMA